MEKSNQSEPEIVTAQMLKDIQKELKPYGRNIATTLAIAMTAETKRKESLIYKHSKKINETTIYNIFNSVITNYKMRFVLYQESKKILERYKQLQQQYLNR